MMTGRQMRMARAAIRWTAEKLAEEAHVSWSTIQRMETSDDVPSALAQTLDAVQQALEAAGIEFIDENGGGPGVRLRDRQG